MRITARFNRKPGFAVDSFIVQMIQRCNRIILFFIETGKLRCILYCSKIKYPLSGFVYRISLFR